MDEHSNEPTVAELLDRIRKLEATVAAISKQVPPMKAKIEDLGKAFEIEIKSASSHFKSVYQYIRDLNHQVWPLVHKVFPGSVRTQRQIAAIVTSGAKSSGRKNS
jgi:predicted  nucleic acid-binding Zn-ribbon protein